MSLFAEGNSPSFRGTRRASKLFSGTDENLRHKSLAGEEAINSPTKVVRSSGLRQIHENIRSPLRDVNGSPRTMTSSPKTLLLSPSSQKQRTGSPRTPKLPETTSIPSVQDDMFDEHGFLRVAPDNEDEVKLTWAQWRQWNDHWQARKKHASLKNRVASWCRALNVPAIRSQYQSLARFQPGKYELDGGVLMSNYDGASDEARWTLQQDIPRTYATHGLFMGRQGICNLSQAPAGAGDAMDSGRRSLFHVLASYAAFNPAVGYCQGMSYVVAAFLMDANEEDVFWILVALLDSPRHLKDFYDPNLSGLLLLGQVYDHLLSKHLQILHAHLTEQSLHHLVYVTPWFMRLFSSLESWPLFACILDDVIHKGHVALLQAALAIMHLIEDDLLLSPTIIQLLPILQTKPPKLTVSSLRAAMNLFQISPEEMEVERRLVHESNQETPRSSRKRPMDDSITLSSQRKRVATPMSQVRMMQAPTPLSSTMFTRLLNVFNNSPSKAEPTTAPSPPILNRDGMLSTFVTSPTSLQAFREFTTPIRPAAQSPSIIGSERKRGVAPARELFSPRQRPIDFKSHLENDD